MFPKKQPSGAQNRKRKQREQDLTNKLQGSLNKYFVRSENNDENSNDVENNDFVNNSKGSIETSNEPTENSNDHENNDFVDKSNLMILIFLIKEYGINALGRHFSCEFYVRKLRNGDSYDRKW
uniref:Uncharacterized protein n=1 Tax=Lactuca sativa TaxID=4236 RepID=A0A9R1XS45_LACSA|nr:hypothetical protein LSAT_V11C100023990 [Lactuca sativa]